MKTNIIADALAALTAGTLSTEDIGTATSGVEREYVFFYKLTDPTQLFKAPLIIEQEQWEIALPQQEGSKYQGWIRVRSERVKNVDGCKYTLALKVAEPDVKGRKELEIEIPEDFFNVYKLLCVNGMHKTRFIMPVEGTEGQFPENQLGTDSLLWEIDVFDDPTTEGAAPWVKVDLEVKGELSEIPAFPLSYSKRITNQWDERTPEEAAFIKELFSKVYTQKNETPAEVPADAEAQGQQPQGADDAGAGA